MVERANAMSSKQGQRQRSPEEQRQLSRMGGYLSAALSTPEQKREQGRRGLLAVLTKKIDPSGILMQRDPAEFERRYTLALKAHMAEMSAARIRKAAEQRAAPKSGFATSATSSRRVRTYVATRFSKRCRGQ
jgi:hypothetical protein